MIDLLSVFKFMAECQELGAGFGKNWAYSDD